MLLLLLHGRHLLWCRRTLLLVFSNDLQIGNSSALHRPLRLARAGVGEEDVDEGERTICHFSHAALQDSVGRLLESDLDGRASEVGHSCSRRLVEGCAG